ncbi:MAG TPA: hypothetical protein VLS89_16985 [Candidatus Nanopelagicales bacterium]|nr:hypothetical protein [Candidatus Nanopelagicales bacterium]
MLLKSLSSLKSLIIGTSLLALAAAGCAEDPAAPAPGGESDAVQNELVSARDIAKLQPGQKLQIDLVDDLVLFLDYTQPLDYARVELSAGESTFSLEDHVLALQSKDYGDNPPIDVTDSPDKSFRVALDPADFGDDLTADELAILRETGYFYKEISGPNVNPQTTGDNCITGICEDCGPPPGYTTCDWFTVGAPPCVCTYEVHQWCD